MTDPPADRQIALSLRARKRAWAVALVTAVLEALIGGGAALNSAPGDRPGGIVMLFVLVLAALAVYPVRRQPSRLARRFVTIGLLQVVAAVTMITEGWGAISIVAVINGILLAGWLLSAALFSAAS